MSDTDTLLKAAINRISARLSQRLIDFTVDLAEKAKDAPEQVKKEWDIFQEEVITEAERLEEKAKKARTDNNHDNSDNGLYNDPQEKIDILREKIAKLSKKVEEVM